MGSTGHARSIGAAVVLLLALTSGLQAAETGATVSPVGSVSGTIAVPTAPPRVARQPSSAPYSGVAASHAHSSAASRRGIHETVVISLHPESFDPMVAPLAEPPRLEQTGMAFVPRVVPVTAGSTIHIVNLDDVFHNVFSLTPGARFDIGHRRTGEVVAQRIEIAGRIEVFCDIHPSMVATIISLDTPYFTRPDSAGKFELPDLPPGRYEARAFHPAYTFSRVPIELVGGEAVTVEFSLAE